MDTRKIVDLRLGAHLRRVLGWRKDLPEPERKAIAEEAAQMMEEGGGPFERMIATSHSAREIFAVEEELARKEMGRLAKQLPVWESFCKNVRGFGEVSLAVIVAEAGDLSCYDNKSKFWKRMGLAAGQNRVPPGLSREDRAAAWIKNAYNPRRRSHMWNIGDAVIKAQVRIIKDADGKDTGERAAIGVYGDVYLRRKAYEHARDPEMSKMHAHRRAQRYMEKRLLRDLWQAWRRATLSMTEKSIVDLPAAFVPSGESQTVSVRKDHLARAFPARGYTIPPSLVKARLALAERPNVGMPSP